MPVPVGPVSTGHDRDVGFDIIFRFYYIFLIGQIQFFPVLPGFDIVSPLFDQGTGIVPEYILPEDWNRKKQENRDTYCQFCKCENQIPSAFRISTPSLFTSGLLRLSPFFSSSSNMIQAFRISVSLPELNRIVISFKVLLSSILSCVIV